jgi:hypothetical protein
MVAIADPPCRSGADKSFGTSRATFHDIPAREPLASWPPVLASQPELIIPETSIIEILWSSTQGVESRSFLIWSNECPAIHRSSRLESEAPETSGWPTIHPEHEPMASMSAMR